MSKVVDLGAESFATFFSVAAKIGFAEEARRRAAAPAELFVTTPDRTAVGAYRHLHGRFPAVMLVPVHNVGGRAVRRPARSSPRRASRVATLAAAAFFASSAS